ncbi:MAG TPA: hypothetical protein VF058_07005 [Actinomycetota bacterium]
MEGASGVIALVLAETAAGSAALLWLTGLWGNVKRGFFILTTATVLACALLAALSANAGATEAGSGGARLVVVLALALSALSALALIALILRRMAAGRVLGLVSIPVGVALLVAMASVAEAGMAMALVGLLAGAAFMGAVTVGLLLGHWYLVDRSLARDHIQRMAVVLIGAVLVEAVAVMIAAVAGDVTPTEGFGLFLTVGGAAFHLAIVLGMVAITALIAFLIRAALRETRPRAVQAATGFFYLAVITAFTAELAAKVRFLG